MLSVGAEGNVQLQHISLEIGMQPRDGNGRQKAQEDTHTVERRLFLMSVNI